MVDRGRLHDVAVRLRALEGLAYESCNFVAAVDLGDRFETVYHLYSFASNTYLELHVAVPRAKPVVDTVCDVWPAADWHEREAFDMMGIRFEGHPDLRRILLPDDWVGHPAAQGLRRLDREPPACLTSSPRARPTRPWPWPCVASPTPRRPAGAARWPAWASTRSWSTWGRSTRRPTACCAWSSPSTASSSKTPSRSIGYLHRSKEKIAEKRTYYQYIPIVDRTEYVAGMNSEWGYVRTVEKLAGIEPTRRAEFIRVIMAELNRIASHQVGVGTFTADLAPLGTAMVFYAFRHREKILDLLEAASGARMMFNYFRFGGVRYDLPDGWVESCRELMLQVPAWCREYEALVNDNAVFLQRCIGKGVMTQEDVADYAITGPNARASGVAHDLRRTRPYSVYPELDFEVCLGSTAMCTTATRCASTRSASRRRSSCNASTCCRPGRCSSAPCGPPYVVTPPPGACYTAQENPRGEYGTYIVSDGSRYPYRLKYRDPCFVNLQIFPKLLRGNKIADAVAISGSMDLVLGGIDR